MVFKRFHRLDTLMLLEASWRPLGESWSVLKDSSEFSTLLKHFVKLCVSDVAKIAPKTPKMHQDNQNAPT